MKLLIVFLILSCFFVVIAKADGKEKCRFYNDGFLVYCTDNGHKPRYSYELNNATNNETLSGPYDVQWESIWESDDPLKSGGSTSITLNSQTWNYSGENNSFVVSANVDSNKLDFDSISFDQSMTNTNMVFTQKDGTKEYNATVPVVKFSITITNYVWQDEKNTLQVSLTLSGGNSSSYNCSSYENGTYSIQYAKAFLTSESYQQPIAFNPQNKSENATVDFQLLCGSGNTNGEIIFSYGNFTNGWTLYHDPYTGVNSVYDAETTITIYPDDGNYDWIYYVLGALALVICVVVIFGILAAAFMAYKKKQESESLYDNA